jgi:hypothetical protein
LNKSLVQWSRALRFSLRKQLRFFRRPFSIGGRAAGGCESQVSRILGKLDAARCADISFKVFGANTHRYIIHDPLAEDVIRHFEERYAVVLPAAYKIFLMHVGNGGVGHRDAAAGPFYGIFPLKSCVPEIPVDHPERALANPCLLSPRMSPSDWAALVAEARRTPDDDDCEAADYRLFGGLLPIGSQGCTYLHCLIVNGPYSGRVVNIDTEHSGPPFFAFEPDFLAWYERWLDEVISGDLDQPAISFGYVRGGSEEQLLLELKGSSDATFQEECLSGLLFKRRLTSASLGELVSLYDQYAQHKVSICQVVTKSDYDLARPFLADLGRHDPLAFLQSLHWYAREHVADWQDMILALAEHISDHEVFCFFSYAVERLTIDKGSSLAPFTKNADYRIRKQAYYQLGKINDRERYMGYFIAGLNDCNNYVVHSVLQALRGMADPALMPHYKKLAERFPVEQDYILTNLQGRLTELGTSLDQLRAEL